MARVVAAPGTGGIKLEVSVDGALGAAATATESASSAAIASTEAVTATLTGGSASVTTADQVTYTLTFTNASDTAAQLTGLPAALAAPPGTTAAGSPSGSTTVAANGSTAWTLTADVDDADPAGTVLTQLPGAVSYGMSAIGLAPRAVAVTPAGVTSTVIVPDVTNPDVTINQASGQADPTSTWPIHFTVTFSESVTGFDAADVDLTASSVGGVLSSVVTGGGSTYTVDVSGMTTGGTVVASIPAFAAIDASSNPSNASTSLDHTVTWVQSIASSVSVALTPTSRVYGQPAQAAATVGVTSGTPAGTVQFDVDGADVGSPVAVGAGGIAVSPTLTGSGGAAPTAGSHTVTATFTPTDPVTYAGSNGSTGLVVDKAATEVSVSVAPTSLHATVTATAPGAGEPGGTVTFSVDGQSVGSAPVSGGAAQLSYKTPSGKTRHIAALYSGDANFTASSASTARHDPAITAHASSAHAKTSYGWYRSSVTVTFTCATNGAPLVASCPSPVTLTHNGAAQSVSRTISATDGGMATATAHGINLDHSLPIVKVTGVTNGGRYARPGPTPHCTPSDALSGVASCTLTRYSTRHGDVTTVHYTGTAKDKAGNARATSGTFQLSSFAIQGATFSTGAYTVHRGHTYLFVVNSSTRPAYYDAAPFPATPFQPDPLAMRSAGYHRWSLPVMMTQSLRAHLYWNIGIKIGSTLHVLKIRVLA